MGTGPAVAEFFGSPGSLSENGLGICSLHFLLELLILTREPNSGRDVLGLILIILWEELKISLLYVTCPILLCFSYEKETQIFRFARVWC